MNASKATATVMRSAASVVLDNLGTNSQTARFDFGDPERTLWSYTPRDHAGIRLLEMDGSARKAFHRLLATALSRAGLAQAVTIMALEEILDLDEAGRIGRHSSGYHLAVFGDPQAHRFAWRIEGHHLSVSATVVGETASVGPVFLGANPHRLSTGHIEVLAPLAAEERLARDLMEALPTDLHRMALVTSVPPSDIRSRNTERIPADVFRPAGVSVNKLAEEHRQLVADMAGLYIGRLAPGVFARPDLNELHFAFLGSTKTGKGHYYRLFGPGLLIEYSNPAGDHGHTVIRSPGGDFGFDLLTAGQSA